MYKQFRAWFIVALLMALMLINFLDKVLLGMVAVPLMAELKLTPSEFGVLGGSFFWLFAISGVVFGLVANKASPKTLILLMALAWSVCQLPIFFTSSLAVLLLCRVLLGIGEGPTWAIAIHALYKWFPNERRALPISILAQGGMAGLLVAGAVIPLVTHLYGWRANFAILSAVGLVWAIAWYFWGVDGPLDNKPLPSAQTPRRTTVPYRRLLLNRTVVAVILMHFAFYWSFAVVLTWLPAYLNKGLGYSPVVAGRFFSYFVFVNIPVNIALCALAQRMSRAGYSSRVARGMFISVSFLVGGLLLFVPGTTEVSPIAKITALAISFGMITSIVSLGPAILGELAPTAQRAGLIAIDTAIASVAGAVAPVLMGWIIQWGVGRMALANSYELGFGIAGALLILAGFLGVWLIRPEQSAAALLQYHVEGDTPYQLKEAMS